MDNYLVTDNNSKDTPLTACIYFSSNGFYPKNTIEEFQDCVTDRNSFEFFNHRMDGVDRHIFVRDNSKQFYLSGINNRVNNIESLKNLLSDLTKNMDVMCIGSSAGGGAAILYGTLIGAKKIVVFNPVIDLLDEEDFPLSSYDTYPDLFNYRKDPKMADYLFLPNLLLKNKDIIKNILIFTSFYSKEDQKRISKLANVVSGIIKIDSDIHGVPVLSSILKFLYIKFNKMIDKRFFKRVINRFEFGFLLIGMSFFYYLTLEMIRKFKNKVIKIIKT